MNNLRTPPPPKFLQKPYPYFFMVHLLHRLYGVDAPELQKVGSATRDLNCMHDFDNLYSPRNTVAAINKQKQ